MKLLYFGTVCSFERYNELLKHCEYKPSVATIVFETALLEGFRQNGIEMEIHSYPMVPTIPKAKLLKFGGETETLPCGYQCHWLNTINVPVLKQISRRRDAKKALLRWLEENREDGMIFTYSIPPFLVQDILKYAKKYSVKVVTIIPDLLRDMYINEDAKSPITKLKQLYLKPALKLQGEYDGYIYLTDAMHSVVAPDKPYMVMESIAGAVPHKGDPAEKSLPRAVMYAGALHEKYGILNLVEAFERLERPDVQLWLFGEGTAAEQIRQRAAADPSICYFGSVTRDKVLEYEQAATLLVNPRDPGEEFTQYSFPSKTIEYMLSGTPLLTTRLPGIPEEYFDYVFSAEDNGVDSLRNAMEQALTCSHEELTRMGAEARAFVQREKNAKKQTERIIQFMNEVKHDSAVGYKEI